MTFLFVFLFSLIYGQDSIDIELDLDAMWENTVWIEIENVVDAGYEVEKVTAVAGVRGAEAEDEALALLYYRRSMRGLSLLDLNKAYGKLKITKDNYLKKNPKHPKIIKIDKLLYEIDQKIKKF